MIKIEILKIKTLRIDKPKKLYILFTQRIGKF